MVIGGRKGEGKGRAVWACTHYTRGTSTVPRARAPARPACVRACGVGGRAVVPWRQGRKRRS